MTSFQTIYDRFFGMITDDMYLNGDPNNELWNEQDTIKDCRNMLQEAIPGFEFPRFSLTEFDGVDYDNSNSFAADLTDEEINILARLMLLKWLGRQINSVENTRMKYTGSDFKMTSQANHLSKLLNLQTENERLDRHYQRLYKRRRTESSKIRSNWDIFGTISKKYYDV